MGLLHLNETDVRVLYFDNGLQVSCNHIHGKKEWNSAKKTGESQAPLKCTTSTLALSCFAPELLSTLYKTLFVCDRGAWSTIIKYIIVFRTSGTSLTDESHPEVD